MELAQLANEMQMMTDPRRPLINMGERCGVDSAKRLAGSLMQSVQYGTPLTEALRGLATELRAESIIRLEARAARMPVLLTLPMMIFILPSLFLVIGGPALYRCCMPCLSFKRLFALAALLVLAACGNHASSLDAIRQDAELGDAALNAGTPELALRLADDTLSRDPKTPTPSSAAVPHSPRSAGSTRPATT